MNAPAGAALRTISSRSWATGCWRRPLRTHGGLAIALDEVPDIGGIAVHKQTALDLVKQKKKKLDQEVVDNAPKISLRHLGF